MTNAYHSMPVELSDSTLLKMLLRSGYVVTLGQVLYHLFAYPAAIEEFGFRVGESPFQVWHCACIRSLFTKVGWVVKIDLMVGASLNIMSEHQDTSHKG